MTLGALLYGAQKHDSLLRASIADAGNEHRLGSHEAPPAILSVYLGDYLSDILDHIEGVKKIVLYWTKRANLNNKLKQSNAPI